MVTGIGKNRLEAFSDGVIAIIITIMVLEMKVPHGHEPTLETLKPIIPIFLSYVLSFIYLGIYWNNHHHMLHTVKHVNGGILWANLHLLFWLSVVPFVTAWMGDNHFAFWPVVLYGLVLLGAAIAYFILTNAIVCSHGKDSVLAKAIGNDVKGKVSILIYMSAIGLAFVHPLLACLCYAIVAIIWLVPDRRIERVLVSVALIGVVLYPHYSFATVEPSEQQKIDSSQLIVVGNVVSVDVSSEDTSIGRASVKVLVTKIVKGDLKGDELVFTFSYGGGGKGDLTKEELLQKWNGFKDDKAVLKFYLVNVTNDQRYSKTGISGWILNDEWFGYQVLE